MAFVMIRKLIPLGALVTAALSTAVGARPHCPALRVMTYNIRLDLESDGINRWTERREQFTGQIGLMHPAILGLQEVLRRQKADLERALPDYAFLGLPREEGGESASLAFDRNIFRLQSSGTFWLSPTPNLPSKGWDAAYRRVATWAHLVRIGDGRQFLALNTHLDNEGKEARLEGARQISNWIASNRARNELVVLTGDFNTTAHSPPVQLLTSAPLNLRDARAVSKTPPVGPEGTWNNFMLLPKESQRIDFILLDPKMAVERYGILAWHSDGGRVASDHFPVVADIDPCPARQ
jgi:endonuclease/exonuclease/phosphatase family metal-dependent hydrolase